MAEGLDKDAAAARVIEETGDAVRGDIKSFNWRGDAA